MVVMGSFLFHDIPFNWKLSECNDYPEVVKIPKGCHGVVKSCQRVVMMVVTGSS